MKYNGENYEWVKKICMPVEIVHEVCEKCKHYIHYDKANNEHPECPLEKALTFHIVADGELPQNTFYAKTIRADLFNQNRATVKSLGCRFFIRG